MRKIILDLSVPKSIKETQKYLAEQLGTESKYGGSTDALYDELTSIAEPTVIGIFMPMGDMMDLDFDLMLYFDKLAQVFTEAENDNPELAVIFGDLTMNPGYEDAYDDYFDEDDDYDDYTGERISDISRRQRSTNIGAWSDDTDDDALAGTDFESEEAGEDGDVPGDHDVVMLDISKFRR